MLVKNILIMILILPLTVVGKEVVLDVMITISVVKDICLSLKENDILKISSYGGYTLPAIELSLCVRDKSVTVSIDHAESAATFIVLAAKKVCFNKKVAIGFHSPIFLNKKTREPEDFSISKMSRYVVFMQYFYERWGYTPTQVAALLVMVIKTPPSGMHYLKHEEAVTLLGDRYIGSCDNAQSIPQ
jgi:hypothetical protein